MNKKNYKLKSKDLFTLIFFGAIAYLASGFFLTKANEDFGSLVIGVTIFFIGASYQYAVLRYHIRKENEVDEKIQSMEKNIQDIVEILHIVKDLLKR